MLEHPQQFNITQSELTPRVADYFNNLLAQRDAILDRYNLTPETADEFCNLQSTDADREKMLALYEKMVYVIEHKEIPSYLDKQEKYRLAQEIMREDFFGIEAVEKTFDFHLDKETIPDIPFTFEELDRARQLGLFLILRVDKTDDDTPLTMDEMQKMLEYRWEQNGEGVVFQYVGFYQNQDFFCEETAQFSWALVSKDVISHSTSKNYLEQTDCLIDYLKNTIYQDKEIPEPYKSAIREFEQERNDIQIFMDDEWKKATKKLENLAITKLVRQTPVEVIYDMLIYFINKGERLLRGKEVFTSRCNSKDSLIFVGKFDYVYDADFSGDCVIVHGLGPNDEHEEVGAVIARRY